MDKIAQQLKAYIDTHPLDLGEGDCKTVLDQLYQAYAESHESDPPEISNGFKELEELEEELKDIKDLDGDELEHYYFDSKEEYEKRLDDN